MTKISKSIVGTVIEKITENGTIYKIKAGEKIYRGHYSNIFTESFRHLEIGENVLFRPIEGQPNKAKYIIRLEMDNDWLHPCKTTNL